jgi:lipoyl(octanoyl) transferase
MNDLIVRRYQDLQDYPATWQAMRQFTDQRQTHTPDEIWLLQHRPVFTLGQSGKTEHLLQANPDIPVIHSDRGGQITYHGPGQLVLYLLMDLSRRHLGVRQLVSILEQSVIDLLAAYGISAHRRPRAPGVYVWCREKDSESKIAALGLRIRHGCSYHGLALNLDVDLSPFAAINPCGYPGQTVTRLTDLLDPMPDQMQIENDLIRQLQKQLQEPSQAQRDRRTD